MLAAAETDAATMVAPATETGDQAGAQTPTGRPVSATPFCLAKARSV